MGQRRKRHCKGRTRAGKPCKAWPLHGSDRCLAHSDGKTRESTGFGDTQGRAGRPAVPRITELRRRQVEAEAEAILEPYLRAIKGAVLHATYQGEITLTDIPDLGARIDAAEKLLDRIEGRPRQLTELSGPEGSPVEVNLKDPETARLAHELLAKLPVRRDD